MRAWRRRKAEVRRRVGCQLTAGQFKLRRCPPSSSASCGATRLTRGAGEASSSLGHGALVDCGLGRARGDAGTGSWPDVIVKQRPAGRGGQGRGRLRRGARARQAATGGLPGSAPDSPAGLRSVVAQRNAEGGAILASVVPGWA